MKTSGGIEGARSSFPGAVEARACSLSCAVDKRVSRRAISARKARSSAAAAAAVIIGWPLLSRYAWKGEIINNRGDYCSKMYDDGSFFGMVGFPSGRESEDGHVLWNWFHHSRSQEVTTIYLRLECIHRMILL